jgi:hypothetical protein
MLLKNLTSGRVLSSRRRKPAATPLVIQFIPPDRFTFLLAVSFLVDGVLGGINSISSAIGGGFFGVFAEEVSKGLSSAVYGAVLTMAAGAEGVVRMVAAPFVNSYNEGLTNSNTQFCSGELPHRAER